MQSNCNLYVSGNESKGVSLETLAWLEQRSICEFFLFYFPGLILVGFRFRGRRNWDWEWIEANGNLGQSWTAAWAFELVGCVFLLWMMIMAYQVYRDDL